MLPFHLFELQSKWIAGVLSGRITLPSKKDMMGEIKIIYDTLEAQGVPKRYTHYLGLPQVRFSVTYVSAVRQKPNGTH